MNILFVNYGDFTTNSLNHIGGFANTLCAAGHACVVAVPQRRETLKHIATALFIPATFEELLARPGLFPDGKPATVIHAWTPREVVRKFVVDYQRSTNAAARVIIHLEDNERFLLETHTGKSYAALRAASPMELEVELDDSLSHPLRHESFLHIADGVTCIVNRLREFVPADIPTQLLPPGVDFELYRPQEPDLAWRRELGLRDEEKVIAFTGSTTFANEPEMRDLYLAVALLNQRGTPTRLVRTGFNSPRFLAGLPDNVKTHVLDLGFVAKAQLPRLLALADVLVQPGSPGAFNDYRLPSKLPEFLASGRPVVLPPTNIASSMQNGREAVFLANGSPAEIADTCERLLANPELCARLGQAGAAFARRHFDLATNTQALAEFYASVMQRPPTVDWSIAQRIKITDATLLAQRLNAQAGALGPTGRPVALEAGLLADIVSQLEQSGKAGGIAGEALSALPRGQVTAEHVRNLEHLLTAARENCARTEHVRVLTQNHADNMEKIAAHNERRRGQAEALLQTARQQVTAYENALLGADAEIERQKEAVAAKQEEFVAAQKETEAFKAHLAHAERVVRARDEKIAKMQASFSWRITAPFRALRRAFLDRPAAPRASEAVFGNIDYPQDWSRVPPTLNVRGWTLARDKKPVKAIRARLGQQSVSVEFGLERLDVLDQFADHPGAEHCGWIVKAAIPRRGTHRLVIEAQTESGEWHIAFARELKRTIGEVPPPPGTYAAWVAAYDTLTPETADRIRQKVAGLSKRPLISVLMPVYNPGEKWLVRAIESVMRQLYDRWELCIADDASTAPYVRAVLERYQKKDPRIKVVFRESNGHISAASNSALALAHGEFIALLDHDDELRPHALACVALELAAHPEADLVYSDEDKIDENGHRYDHYFKPDWNPDLFLAQNYISHLGVYRTLLVREVGGFRVGYEGSQDWDLAMRVIERSAPDRIRHIPKVLYHWRSVPGSTAMLIGAKNYAVAAAEKVITDHFTRCGITATISPTKGSYWRIHFPIPDPAPLVALVIPTRNRVELLRPCVESILEKTSYPNFEILIVDNDSDDPATLEYLRSFATEAGPNGHATTSSEKDSSPGFAARPETNGHTQTAVLEPKPRIAVAAPVRRVRVVRYPGEFNFSAINNFGVAQTDATVIGLLNNDLTVISPDWLTEMVSQALRPDIGCVGAKLYYPDDRIQHAGVILGIGGVAAHAWQTHPRGAAGQAHRNLLQQNLSAVTAACLVVRREVFDQIGGFDEKLKVAFNDVDFCLKARAAGYRNLWTPYAELYHHESASRGAEDTLEKRDRFRGEVEYVQGKWGDALLNDPAYNPNLTLTINDFTLAVPPRPWAPLDS